MERDRQFRIEALHAALTAQGKQRIPVTAATLLQVVRQRLGKDYNLKTIRRDLEHMRKKLGLPIRYDARRRTFCYDGPAHIQPLSVGLLSNADARMLLVARQAADHLSGTPWHRPLRDLYDRLVSAFPAPLIDEHAGIISRIRFEGPQVQPIRAEVWKLLIEALVEEETLLMVYRSGSGGKTLERRFDPYALVVVDRHWQVIGYDHHHRGVRTFLVTRIQQLKPSNESFRLRGGFELDRHLEDAVAGQPAAGEAKRVHLRFTRAASAAGENQVWHRREERWHDEHDRLNVRFRTAALFKVQREVLAWGGQLAVLAPPELRQSVAQAVAELQTSLHAETDCPGLFVEGATMPLASRGGE